MTHVRGIKSLLIERFSLAVAGFLGLICALAIADRAQAYVYYEVSDPKTSRTTIGRAELDGSGRESEFIHRLKGDYLVDIAVDRRHVYWAMNSGYIGRANLDGTDVRPKFIETGSVVLSSIALDSTHVYWLSRHGELSRARLDGTGVQEPFIENGEPEEWTGACAMASNGRHVYWVNHHDTGKKLISVKGELWPTTIGRASIAARTWIDPLVTGTEYSWAYCGIAVNTKSLFWTDGRLDAVVSSGLDGSGAKPLVAGLSEPCGLELVGNYVYWDSGPFLGRAAVNGGKVERKLTRFPDIECTLAVDSLSPGDKK
jgi:hypothetical protein